MTADQPPSAARPNFDIDAAAALASLRSNSPPESPAAQAQQSGQQQQQQGVPGKNPGGAIGPTSARKDKFPVKLMEILSNDAYSDSVTWLPHGRSFIFVSPEKFTADVLPRYFKGCKFSSFTRKLYRWGFRQISKGPDAESFFHKHFRRDKKNLCQMIACGREIRDGCPELHEGISAESLMRHEQSEMRDEMMRMRSRQMRELCAGQQQRQMQMAAMGAAGLGAGLGARAGLMGMTGAMGPGPAGMRLDRDAFQSAAALEREAALIRAAAAEGARDAALVRRSLGLPPIPSSLAGTEAAAMTSPATASAASDLDRLDMMQERMIQLRRQQQLEEMMYLERAREMRELSRLEAAAFPQGSADHSMDYLGRRAPSALALVDDAAVMQHQMERRQQQLGGSGVMSPPPAVVGLSRKDSVDVEQPMPPLPGQQQEQRQQQSTPTMRPILPKGPLPKALPAGSFLPKQPPSSSSGLPLIAPKQSSSDDLLKAPSSSSMKASSSSNLLNKATSSPSSSNLLMAQQASAAAFEDAVQAQGALPPGDAADDPSNMVAAGVIRRAIDALRRAY